jgi:hypothetical protein
MNKSKGKLLKLGEEKPDMIFNQVWEVTCMTWPTSMPKKMDKSKVKIIRAS